MLDDNIPQEKLFFTGHSLGGYLAEIHAVTSNAFVLSFESPGTR